MFGHVCAQGDDDEDSVPDIDDLDIGDEEADEVLARPASPKMVL